MEALFGALGALIGAFCAFMAFRFHQLRQETQTDLDRARKRIEELDGKVLHAVEDRDKSIRRLQDKSAEELKYAHKDLAFELLDVADNLGRSLEHTDAEGFKQGVVMIGQQLDAALRRHGIEEVEALGQHFDPRLHEVVETEESVEAEDTVLREWVRGYTINGRVLRASKVVLAVPVGSKASEAEEAEVVEPPPPPEPPSEELEGDETQPLPDLEELPDEEPAEEPPDEEPPAEEPEEEEPPAEEPPAEEPDEDVGEVATDAGADEEPIIIQDKPDEGVEYVVTLDRPLAEIGEEDLDSTEVVQEMLIDEITEDLPMVNMEIEE